MVTLLQILGSVGIFLFGMKVMSEGIQKFAGAKMRGALASVTNNRVSGVLTGLCTTGLIQSSTATTVLVISLVNAGLLTLVQSVGVIMGANLGTTLTAWIVAAVGSFSFAAIAIPIVGVGFPLFFVGKERVRFFGEFLIGFGLLFLGLNFLKESVPDMNTMLETDPRMAATIQQVIQFMSGHGYFSYLLFLVAGIVLTLVVQSSTAAMAITITCALNGWFGTEPLDVFRISAAIVLGENIGTTVTAWLAALGSGINARRAAYAHFLFNAIGTVWMLVVFLPFTKLILALTGYLPESMRSADDTYQSSEVAFATAMFHTGFNLLNVFFHIWFVPQFTNLVIRMVRERGEDKQEEQIPRLRYQSQRLVDIGELNLVEAESSIQLMSKNCLAMYRGFEEVFTDPGEDSADKIAHLKSMEDDADLMMQDITDYLVRCSAHEISEQNAVHVVTMIRVVSEIEECTDRIFRLLKLTDQKIKKGREFSEEQIQKVTHLSGIVGQMLCTSDNYLVQPVPADVMGSVRSLESQTNSLRKQYNKLAMKRMASGDVRVEMIFTDMNNQLEAIANHALNILEASHQVTLEG